MCPYQQPTQILLHKNGYGSFLIITWKLQGFLSHRAGLYSQRDETALGDANFEIFLAQNVRVRGVSSSTSGLCEQPPRPFAAGGLLKWEHIGGLHAHVIWRRKRADLLARNLERLFPSCLLKLLILKYLVSIKNEKSMLFKSQCFSSVYQKCPCGC